MIDLKLEKIFKNKCLYKKNGIRHDTLGFLSYLLILFYIIELLYILIITIKVIKKLKNFKKNGIDINQFPSYSSIILNLIKTYVVIIVSIIFFYNMAKICRGFLGFLLIIFIGYLIVKINNYFKNNIEFDIYMILQMNDDGTSPDMAHYLNLHHFKNM